MELKYKDFSLIITKEEIKSGIQFIKGVVKKLKIP